MKLPQTGGCQCGKIRYEIGEAPQLVYTCHCRDCQRLTSSAFSLGIVVSEAGFRMSGVEPRPLLRLADSGRTNTRWVVSGVRLLGCQPAQGRAGTRPGRHARRYVVAHADPRHLDAQQAALGQFRRGPRDLRDGPARVTSNERAGLDANAGGRESLGG